MNLFLLNPARWLKFLINPSKFFSQKFENLKLKTLAAELFFGFFVLYLLLAVFVPQEFDLTTPSVTDILLTAVMMSVMGFVGYSASVGGIYTLIHFTKGRGSLVPIAYAVSLPVFLAQIAMFVLAILPLGESLTAIVQSVLLIAAFIYSVLALSAANKCSKLHAFILGAVGGMVGALVLLVITVVVFGGTMFLLSTAPNPNGNYTYNIGSIDKIDVTDAKVYTNGEYMGVFDESGWISFDSPKAYIKITVISKDNKTLEGTMSPGDIATVDFKSMKIYID